MVPEIVPFSQSKRRMDGHGILGALSDEPRELPPHPAWRPALVRAMASRRVPAALMPGLPAILVATPVTACYRTRQPGAR